MRIKIIISAVVLSILLFLMIAKAMKQHDFNLVPLSENLQTSVLSFYEEVDGPVPVQKIATLYEKGNFKPIEGNSVNFGRTSHRYWMHFNLKTKDSKKELMLAFDNPHIYHLKVYSLVNGQLAELYNGGSDLPFSQRPFPNRNFVFPLNPPLNQVSDYFILLDRVNEVLKFSVNLYDKQNFMNSYNSGYLFYGLFNGIILFIILFSAFLWMSLKGEIHLWYILYLLLALIFVLADSGLGYELIWSKYPELNKHIRTPTGMLAFAVQLQFMQLFISQTKGNSRYFSMVNITKWLFFSLSILFVIIVSFEINLSGNVLKNFQASGNTAYIVGILLVFLSLIEKILQKNKVALIYLVAILTLLVQVGVVIMMRWHLIESAIDTSLTLAYCLLAEIMVLTLGLTFRYNYYKVEKNKLEMSLIAHKNATLTNVLVAIDEEKRRIAEDLHDELGGTLSVIKGMLSNVGQNADSKTQQTLIRSQNLLDQVCKGLRFIAHDLMPVDFNHSSLSSELEEAIYKANIASSSTRFSYLVSGEEREIDKHIELNIFRMMNELIHNIRKHARAGTALVQLTYHQDFFQLMVEDDGCGFDLHAVEKNGIGFRNLKSRAEYINAEIHIDSSKNGTTIICNVPYKDN
jgi:signal transduction histidine kinase